MTTVFNMVGIFRSVTRQHEGDNNPVHKTERITLMPDMTPTDCAFGRTVLHSVAMSEAKKHILVKGPVRRWLVDWELEEKQVKEVKAA